MTTPVLPTPQIQSRRKAASTIWLVFSLCALTAIGFFFIPAFIIRPFRHQAPRALYVAMALRQRAPLPTLVAAVACFVLAFVLWKGASRLGKAILAATLVVVSFSAVMARVNYFEWMFHPIDGPQFVAQSASKLDPKEMIMAVRLGGRLGEEARAYPISEMAYHHVLNDVVAGVPIAVTY